MCNNHKVKKTNIIVFCFVLYWVINLNDINYHLAIGINTLKVYYKSELII